VLHSNILTFKLVGLLNSIERKETQKIRTNKGKHEIQNGDEPIYPILITKLELNDLKLCLTFHYNITRKSQCQVLFFQWQGIGPARTWRSAATANALFGNVSPRQRETLAYVLPSSSQQYDD